jgi:hypothetical protein
LLRQIAARVSRLAMTPARLLQLVPVEIEVASLTEAAKGNRYGHRAATMILVRHGLQGLRTGRPALGPNRYFDTANLSVRRAKKGSPATHPIRGDELRALRKLKREQERTSPFVFTSERGSPFTPAGFAQFKDFWR